MSRGAAGNELFRRLRRPPSLNTGAGIQGEGRTGFHPSVALLSALGDRGKELGLDTLGGFLSGLFLSGAKSGYNAVQFNRMGQEAFDTGSFQDYISLGLLADHDSEAYQYAQEIRAKLNAGRAVTNIEMGQLAAAVYADTLGVGEKWNAEAAEDVDDILEDMPFESNDELNRRIGNAGAFASLPERMSKKHIRAVAKEFDISMKGIIMNIDSDSEKMSDEFFFTGRADPQSIGRIDFFPKAFSSKEELVRTLYHEKIHVQQFREYGAEYVQNNRAFFEDLAYQAENEFILRMKGLGLL